MELDINMCQYLNVEIENTAEFITDDSVERFLGNKNFQFLPGTAVITKDQSNLQKLGALKSEWLEIENDYLKLLNLQAPHSKAVPEKVTLKLVDQKIIPANLPVEARESMGNVLKISIPGKYKSNILEHCIDFISEHALEVTPLVSDTLYQQSGSKEIKSALNALQHQQRLSGGFTTIRSGKTYIVLGDKNDIEKIRSWVRHPVSINPVYKIAVKLEAAANNAPATNFKAACDSLKIICDSHYSILSKDDVATDIKIDPENLQKLNKVAENYVIISPEVYKFILKGLTMRDCENLCVEINRKTEYLISENLLGDIYKTLVPPFFVSKRVPNKVMTNPCFVGDDYMCDRSEVDEQKDHPYDFNDLAKEIVRWKIAQHFAPMVYRTLTPLQYQPTLDQEQKLMSDIPVVLGVGTNTQSFMPLKGNYHSGSNGIVEELKGNPGSSSGSSSKSGSNSSSNSTSYSGYGGGSRY